MIILHNLAWSNWFSYGEDNFINFKNSTLTQILGQNGSGKTSIIHIIEEVLYNKNSKGVKKSDIMNRTKKEMKATLKFSIDSDNYTITLVRKSTAKVSLYKNDEDISSHTATNTFKDIQKIIGMEFGTFSQLVYQNSKQGLEFLTSADSARKKFLISLFNLDKYTNYYDIFKKAYNNVNMESRDLEGQKKVLSNWLNDHRDIDFSIKQLKPIIDDQPLHKLLSNIQHKQDELKTITITNGNIIRNNRAIEHFNSLYKPKELPDKPILKDTNIEVDMKVLSNGINKDLILIRDLESLKSTECSTCFQVINTKIKENMLDGVKEHIRDKKEKLNNLKKIFDNYNKELSEYNNLKTKHDLYKLAESQIDHSLPIEEVTKESIEKDIEDLNITYDKLRKSINEVNQYNREANTHNTKVETILAEINKNTKAITLVNTKLDNIMNVKTKLDILKTVFSTKGLVSYKIDFLIKDLENKINEYLVVLSDGRFQLNFILKSDSINIGIIDNGKSVDISALSTGELSRVNVATLLAIRALMSTLSNTKINLLFLDEIMGVLDEQGKTNLIDILLKENDLNTYIVSHEYTHPLLDKIYVVKEEGGSKIG